MNLRLLAAIGVITALALVGCGGGDDDGGSGDQQALPVTAKDKTEITKVYVKLERASRAGDGKGLCALFQPALVDEAFGSKARCVKNFNRVSSPPGSKDLQVDEITATSTGATATYKNSPGLTVDFVKIDDKWYIDLSSVIDPNAAPSPG